MGDCIAVNEKALASHSPQKWSASIILGAWLAHQNLDPRLDWQAMRESALSQMDQVGVMLLRNGIPAKPTSVSRVFGNVHSPRLWGTTVEGLLLDAVERGDIRGTFSVNFIGDTITYSSSSLLALDNNYITPPN